MQVAILMSYHGSSIDSGSRLAYSNGTVKETGPIIMDAGSVSSNHVLFETWDRFLEYLRGTNVSPLWFCCPEQEVALEQADGLSNGLPRTL